MTEVASQSGIDLNVLAGLESRLGRTSMVGLVTAHLRHSEVVCDRLLAMTPAIDRKELHAIGHQIVGSCGSIGLVALSQLGGTLEDEARQAPVEALREIIDATLNACREAQSVLRARYPEVAA
jgi:HPt (histidine-containing phosphotransfer) domain-containing protein